MKLYRTLFASTALTGALAACSEDTKPVTGNARPITAEQVTTFSITNSRTLLAEVWDLRKWLDKNVVLDDLSDAIPFGSQSPEPGEPVEEPDYDGELDELLGDVEGFLKDQLLDVATVESEADTAVTYLIDANKLCDFDPTATPELDAWGDPIEDEGKDCYDFIASTEVRVKVTSFAQGDLDATVLVGADRDAVLRVELHHDLASVEVDLAAAVDVVQRYLDLESPDANAVVHATGKARVVARRLADDQMRISAEVLSPIDAGYTDDAGELGLTFAEGSVAIDIDAPNDEATLDVDLGAFTMKSPKELLPFIDSGCYEVQEEIDGEIIIYEECDEENAPALEGNGSVSFGGLAMYVDLDDSKSELAVRGLVLGKLAITADDKTIIEVGGDVNAAPVDVTFASDANDDLTLTLSQAFALTGMFRTAQVPELFDFGTWAEDEDLGVAFGGDEPAFKLADHGVVLSSGSATFTSKHARDTSLEVSAGQCMFFSDDEESEHPFDFSIADQCPVPSEEL